MEVDPHRPTASKCQRWEDHKDFHRQTGGFEMELTPVGMDIAKHVFQVHAVEAWMGARLARLQPSARRRLARTLAVALRRSQQSRIAAQRNPDGSAFAPRKARAPLRAAARENGAHSAQASGDVCQTAHRALFKKPKRCTRYHGGLYRPRRPPGARAPLWRNRSGRPRRAGLSISRPKIIRLHAR